MRRSRRRSRAGFTLIEVMVSLGVMMVGAMAVITLQQQSVRANVHARDLTIAMQIAQRWMERLKEDAHGWTAIGTNLTGTALLGQGMTGAATEFKSLPSVGAAADGNLVSNAFDGFGQDVPNQGVGANYVYCASYRPAWIWSGHLMRMDLRVWWARDAVRNDVNATRPNIVTDFPQCGDDNAKLLPGGTQYDWYHVVYLSGAIRVTEVRR